MAKSAAQSVEAPYFVDLVNSTLQDKFQDTDFQSNAFRVYTTLDLLFLERFHPGLGRDGTLLRIPLLSFEGTPSSPDSRSDAAAMPVKSNRDRLSSKSRPSDP